MRIIKIKIIIANSVMSRHAGDEIPGKLRTTVTPLSAPRNDQNRFSRATMLLVVNICSNNHITTITKCPSLDPSSTLILELIIFLVKGHFEDSFS
jgi:hypothetical protein